MERILISGVDSTLGANFAAALETVGEVPVLRGAAAPPSRAVAERLNELPTLLDEERPAAAIHCGPLSVSSWDPRAVTRHELSHELEFVSGLVTMCGERELPVGVLTTDGLFAGPRMFHDEESTSYAASPWADAARRLEQAAMAPRALVIRAHAYCLAANEAQSGVVDTFWNALTAGRAFDADTQRHATPILAHDLAHLVRDMLRRGAAGLYHLSGGERTSPYRLACELATLAGAPGELARPVDAQIAGQRVEETSLNTAAARRQLGRPMPLLREGLERFVELARGDFRERVARHVHSATLEKQAA